MKTSPDKAFDVPKTKQSKPLTEKTSNNTDGLNAKEIDITNGITAYMEKMAPNVLLKPENGAKYQIDLYHTLNRVFSYDSDRFAILYKWVLKNVALNRKNKGAFSDRLAMRFYSYMNISDADLSLYRKLTNLVIVTADLKLKSEVVKRVNIRNIVDYMKDQNSKNNIINYYFN